MNVRGGLAEGVEVEGGSIGSDGSACATGPVKEAAAVITLLEPSLCGPQLVFDPFINTFVHLRKYNVVGYSQNNSAALGSVVLNCTVIQQQFTCLSQPFGDDRPSNHCSLGTDDANWFPSALSDWFWFGKQLLKPDAVLEITL